MLRIKVQAPELFLEEENLFIEGNTWILELEHSLFAISKWEAKHKKPFLTKDDKTYEESVDYIRCMTLNQVDDMVYQYLGQKELDKVSEYIDDSQSATWFSDINKTPPSRDIITSEVIYSLMVMLQIPFECQYWHLNRLTTLIRIINIKSKPSKKMGQNELLSRNKTLNEARKKKLNSKG